MEVWGVRQHPKAQQSGQTVTVKDLKGRGVGMRAGGEQAETAGGFVVHELADEQGKINNSKLSLKDYCEEQPWHEQTADIT